MPTKAEIEAAKQREAEDAAAQAEADRKAEAEAKADAQSSPPPQGENRTNMPADQRPPGDLRRRTRREKRKGPFVKYVGSAAERHITPAQWKSVPVKLEDDKTNRTDVWAVGNDKMVEASKFNDEQLDYLLIDDLQPGTNAHSFLLVDYEGDDPDSVQLVQVPYE